MNAMDLIELAISGVFPNRAKLADELGLSEILSDDSMRELAIAEKAKDRPQGRSRKERRAAAREAKLPDSRKCPICEQIKLDSRQWVVKNVASPICLGCFRKGFV